MFLAAVLGCVVRAIFEAVRAFNLKFADERTAPAG
jgi:hypothetical protein